MASVKHNLRVELGGRTIMPPSGEAQQLPCNPTKLHLSAHLMTLVRSRGPQRIMGAQYEIPTDVVMSRDCRDVLGSMLEGPPRRRITIDGIKRWVVAPTHQKSLISSAGDVYEQEVVMLEGAASPQHHHWRHRAVSPTTSKPL